MKAVSALKESVEKLSEDEYTHFRDWFWEYENSKLDSRIEADIRTGKLQTMADKARKDFAEGKYSEL